MAELKLGDKVQEEGKYLGEIVKIETKCTQWYTIKAGDTQGFRERYVQREAGEIELAPKLSPEDAWLAVPMIAITQIKKGRGHMQDSSVIYEFERRAIRHECYVALGGAGVKVTDEVRERVADIVEDVAHAMGLRVV